MTVRMKRLWISMVVAILGYIAAALGIALIGLHDHATAADIIVVPGNTVHADGRLSARLRSRLDAALVLYQHGLAPVIFVSGGIGREGHDEAAAMAGYLAANGVPKAALVEDALGVDTGATARNAARWLRAHEGKTAIVATQYFHVARTELVLERNGVSVTGSRYARYFELRDIYSLAREVPGYAVYFATK